MAESNSLTPPYMVPLSRFLALQPRATGHG